MTDNEILDFIQNNSVRISHRENGYWSAEIPNGSWISASTFIGAVEELHRVVNLTQEDFLADMQKVGREELELAAEHKRIYG